MFKSSFVAFIQTPAQKERLDPLQLTQMIAIVVFHLNDSSSSCSESQSPQQQHQLALELIFFFVEQLIHMSRDDQLTLAPLQVALSFLVSYKSGSCLADNALWRSPANLDDVEKFVRALVKCANEWREAPRAKTPTTTTTVTTLDINELTSSSSNFSVSLSSSRPLMEDRMLQSYLPMQNAHKDINFKFEVSNKNFLTKKNSIKNTLL